MPKAPKVPTQTTQIQDSVLGPRKKAKKVEQVDPKVSAPSLKESEKGTGRC